MRALRTSKEAYDAAKARGHTLISARAIREHLEGIKAQLPKGKTLYISFDIDVFNPALVPGTSSPEVEGLNYGEAIALLAEAIGNNELIGFDLTELAPNLDSSNLTSLVAARLLAEVLALWWQRQ